MIRSMSDYNCCIMGFDIRPYGDAKADYDFNDVLIKLTASPVSAVKPEEDIPVIDEFAPSEAVYGTLAFEDQWPKMGDYDFNDFVMNYAYELEKGDDNSITAVKLTFTPIAKGAAPWTHIGVGIELPLSEDIIDRSKLEGAIIEEGNEWATFIVWNDVNVALGTTEGYVNTEGTATGISGTPAEITVRLKTPVSNLQTRAVPGPEFYPIREFLNKGVLVTVNTDNRTVSDTTMTKELEFIQNTYGIRDEEVLLLMRNAVDAAFAEETVKEKLYRKLAEKK